jgi:hypothetical protein
MRVDRPSTTSESFTVTEWKNAIQNIGGFKVKVPRFQRSLVWSLEQKRSLIASLVNGMPIGTLLVAADQDASRDEADANLVDGLQRSAAIDEFTISPQTLLDLREIKHFTAPFEDLAEAFNSAGVETDTQVLLNVATTWLHSLGSLESSAGFSWDRLGRSLIGPIEQSGAEQALTVGRVEGCLRRIEDLVRETVEQGRMSEVPVLIYRGPREFWPDIFAQLNRAGTPLTRYEVFAAMWEDKEVAESHASARLREIVVHRYAEVNDRGIHLAFDVDSNAPLTLFEYLFALGRAVAEDYPNLFSLPSEPTAENPAIFNLFNVLHGLRTSDMPSLPEHIKDVDDDGRFQLSGLEAAIRRACGGLQDLIGTVATIGVKSQGAGNQKPEVPFTSNQVASLIARLVLSRYDTDTWSEKHSDEAIDEYGQILRNASRHLLHDVLLGVWSGHGDSRLHQVVWDSNSRVAKASSHYVNPVSDSDLGMVLDVWHADQLAKQHTRRVVGQVERLVLKHIHANGNHLDHESNVWEVEHVYPVAGLVKRADGDPQGQWPINAVSNLALLPKSTNRNKSDVTVAGFLGDKPRRMNQNDYDVACDHIRNAVLHDHPETLDWTFGTKPGSSFDRGAFVAFLTERWGAQKQQIRQTLQRLEATCQP